jgi:hypothetical protein
MFSFCKMGHCLECSKYYLIKPHPIHHSEIHTCHKRVCLKMNPLWQESQELMIERLDPESIAALDNQQLSR